MTTDPFEDYCSSVCVMVRWKACRASVSRELTAHMEDHADALTAQGMEPDAAKRAAVAAMGDPYTLGKELDALHSPWYPRLSRVFAALAALLLFIGTVIGLNGNLFERRFAPFADPEALVLLGNTYSLPHLSLSTGPATGGGKVGLYTFSGSGAAALFQPELREKSISYELDLVFSSTTPLFWLDHFRGDNAVWTLRQENGPAQLVPATLFPLPQQGVLRRYYCLSIYLDAPVSGRCKVESDGVYYSFSLEEVPVP